MKNTPEHPQNEFSIEVENKSSLLKRLLIYQKERFPLIAHGILISAFSFSAISYSRISRGLDGFIRWELFLIGIFITITLFLLLRIFDEFKDKEDDALHRKELPVPRGLVSLNELRNIAWIVIIAQLLVILIWIPEMIVLYLLVMGYLSLMGKEFFIADWLKKHPFWYVTSHMLIIPLVDVFASGLDWYLENAAAPFGLLYFFAVSFMNGIVLEIGRKIRSPQKEAPGVLTYTAMLGTSKATWLWILVLFVTLILSIAAAHYAGYALSAFMILGIIFLLCLLPAIFFLKNYSEKSSKYIEYASGIWTIMMYLSLGGIPMVQKLLNFS